MRHWMPLWAVTVLVIMAIGTVWLRLTIVRTTYAIDEADREIRELHLAREQTELKFTAQKSPRKLEILAKSRFGLTQPKPNQVIRKSLRD
jgi:hypothetical protein